MKMCPKCKRPIIGYPAISRKDNKTEICSKCGQEEAIRDFMKAYVHKSNKEDWWWLRK